MKFKFSKPRFLQNIELPKIKIPSEIIALLFAFLLMSLAFLPGLEISPSHKLTPAKFARTFDQAGYTIEDVSDTYHPSFFQEVIADSGEGYYVGYYTFTNNAYARAYYTLYLGSFQTGARTEKYTYTSDYNRFYISTENRLVFLYRNENVMIYINGKASHSAVFNELIEKMKL